ncbi:MAG TPA: transcriptional regulator [Anaerolineaceae bacterium]|nr:transcriptional regulator [Anaerolineaceae bacterium]
MKDNQSLLDVDRMIHEPARLLIMTILSMAEKADFLFLLNETGLTRGNLSTHLSKLEDAGYINIEKTYRGKIPQTLCSITVAGLEAFEKYRKQINKFLKR